MEGLEFDTHSLIKFRILLLQCRNRGFEFTLSVFQAHAGPPDPCVIGPEDTLEPPVTDGPDAFGAAVATDGTRCVVGVPQGDAEALTWFRKAAEQGDAIAK